MEDFFFFVLCLVQPWEIALGQMGITYFPRVCVWKNWCSEFKRPFQQSTLGQEDVADCEHAFSHKQQFSGGKAL